MTWDLLEIEWIENHESLLNDPEVSLKQVYERAEEYFCLKAGYQTSSCKIIEALAVLRGDFSEFRLQLIYYGMTSSKAHQYSWYLETAWGEVLLLASYNFVVGEEVIGDNLGKAKDKILEDIISRSIDDVKELFIKIIKGISIKEVRFDIR